MNQYKNIDEYIDNFPGSTQAIMQKVRKTIKEAAPEAKEKISYGIPTFVFHGNLVHFAGYGHHIGFYPGAAGVANFTGRLSGLKTSKGTIQFPIDKQIPYDLIADITKFRVEQNKNK